jgi:hypothetical protein
MMMRPGFHLQLLFLALLVALALTPLGTPSPARAAPAGQEGASPSSSGAPGDAELEGQVIGINTLAPRPLVQLANLDGTVSVYFASVDAIVTAGIRYGDYLSVIGRKLNEFEFEADIARVDFRSPVGPAPTPYPTPGPLP